MERGEDVGVDGTPTLVIPGPEGAEKPVGAAPMSEVEAAIEEARD